MLASKAKLLDSHDVVLNLFADDVNVYLEICNVELTTPSSCRRLLIAEWGSEWQLCVSVSKCNILSIGKCLMSVLWALLPDLNKYIIMLTVLNCYACQTVQTYRSYHYV